MTKLLIVDDDTRLTKLLGTALGAHGYDVHLHSSCHDAYPLTKEIQPDIIILDVMLGDGAGYEVSRAVRGDPGLYKVPILFMSSLGDKHEVEYGLNQGGDEYLTKPFKLEQILAKLSRLTQFAESLEEKDPETGMLKLPGIDREIDFRLQRGEPFVLCYASIDDYDAFCAAKGAVLAQEVLQMLTQLIPKTLRAHKAYESLSSHLGAGHCLMLVSGVDHKPICTELTRTFARDSERFYIKQELEQGYLVSTKHKGTYSGHPLMALRICIADTAEKTYTSAHDMLHDLGDMQRRTRKGDKETVFVFRQGKKW